MKLWEAFWVRLIDSRLYFYQEKYVPTQQYHGFLELSGACQCSTHKSKKSKYQFKIKTEKGVFLFQTITEDERTSWMANILLARDRKVRSISTGNLSNPSNSNKHSEGPIWMRRRPSSATGVPSSRSTEKGHLSRPCSAESPSKSQAGTIAKLGSGITPRNRSASCNDVPTAHPPPIHMETHPTLRRKQDNFVSKSPNDTNKRSKFFSLPGFRQLSNRFSKSQENVGDKILRNEKGNRIKRGGSLTLDMETQSVTESLSSTHRTRDFNFESLSHSQGFPPRSASVCSDQSTASKTSAHSTLSLDRKSKKRRDHVKNFFTPEKETNIIPSKNSVKTNPVGINKLSGIRCQLNGPIQVSQNKEPIKQQPSPSSKSINTHSTHTSVVARKPPTPTRHIIDTVQYENEQTRVSQSDSSFKAPIPTKRERNGALNSDGLANEIEDRKYNKKRDDRSAVSSEHTDNQKGTDLTQQMNGNIQNKSRHKKNPFYENEALLYNRFSWFHGDLTREDAENLLKFCGNVGSFLIRNSKKHSKHLCLSLRYSDRIRHFKIDRSNYGYSIDGLEGCYTNLNKLVEVFITWNDNMVKPLDKVIQKQTRDITPRTPPLETGK
ncbi:Dual adapter for phosphotyrosine and 3-phosphotyrosine and 3-phosphoinositide isoform X3 [Oopsacas minuta]|uniref:Dual adapter for phosphotyrosine and 3-phosphotyrosine and 3-phosphoinositide isoform X3 n=1 Tax=Oopsacas minuta TaxID=111878 RepID=A0AAV7KES7_9METZ|nr:Dual adapter for phosphotyrosine and 3-phosphotyrosine and 3-phosphoinositide isoform X3 [Oopsacas minuta]